MREVRSAAMEVRPYSADLLADLFAFASRNAAERPEAVYLMPSDIAWRGPTADDVRLWYDDAGLAAYAWFEPLTGVEMDLRWDLAWDGPVAEAMLTWAEVTRRTYPEAHPPFIGLHSMEAWAEALENPRRPEPGDGLWLTSVAFETDSNRIAALARWGFEPSKHFAPDYRFDLAVKLPEVRLPEGMTVRHVEEADLKERVATHRDSWLGSTWRLARYRDIRESSAYDPELDLVVEAGDGTFANCCICWADPVSRIGSFEPVGTRPAWRGKGVTRGLIHEGLRRMKAKGMRVARVETAGFNHPAQALYEGAGFRRAGTKRTFVRLLE